ncbi:MAG: AraC family ligand binding domain-containing protein [Thiomonas sp.]
MWLTCEGRTRRLTPGDTFTLLRGVPHAAALRPARATYGVARRNPR